MLGGWGFRVLGDCTRQGLEDSRAYGLQAGKVKRV